MREKLLDLMKYEGLKPSQLAELLGINPAGISHILAGRNKPGFDLLQKILRRFPRINPDWLMLDSTKMYRDEISEIATHIPIGTPSAPPINEGLFGASVVGNPNTTRQTESGAKATQDSLSAKMPALGQAMADIAMKPNIAVDRIVIFYEDQTFESFTPHKL